MLLFTLQQCQNFSFRQLTLLLLAPPTSAVMGHRLHCVCGHHPGVSMLLLHLQKVDIQEEKQKEGQGQGQERHQHEGRHGRDQNGGDDFELLLLRNLTP